MIISIFNAKWKTAKVTQKRSVVSSLKTGGYIYIQTHTHTTRLALKTQLSAPTKFDALACTAFKLAIQFTVVEQFTIQFTIIKLYTLTPSFLPAF